MEVASVQSTSTVVAIESPSTNASVAAVQQTQPRSAAMPSQAHDPATVAKAVDEVNKKLAGTPTQVVFDFDSRSNRFWLNMVEKNTGKVITEFPPEAVRTIVDSHSPVGLSIDKFR